MSFSDRAIMLGIRHKCGQEVQFWIPVDLIEPIIGEVDEDQVTGLASWMAEQGLLVEEAGSPEELVSQLAGRLAPRNVALIHVEKDASVCPGCGSMLRWLDVLAEFVQMRNDQG